MDLHILALWLMVLQGCLGAFDTIYHHELTQALPQRVTAQRELKIHAIRSITYGGLFIGLALWEWHGLLAWVLLGIFLVEIVFTLIDFVEEDKTRLLPATERVTHTILAVNGGIFTGVLAINTPNWAAQPIGFDWSFHGWLSVFLVLCGIGVTLSGIRDAFASRALKYMKSESPVHFADTPQRVLVTGGTGFIARLLVKALIQDGHEVTLLTRNPKSTAWNFDGQVRCIASMQALSQSARFDAVINLAGARILGQRWTDRQKQVLRNSRIKLTQGVIDWIAHAETKPQILLSASAVGYYGVQVQGDNTPLSETSPPSAIFMSQLCQDWEDAAKQATQYGVNVACMRFGMVLGQGGALPMMLMPVYLGLGGRMGTGKQWLAWIHVQDVLCGLAHVWKIQAAQHADFQAYNFTAPETVTQAEFIATAGQVLKRPTVFATPATPVRLLLGEQADILLEGQRVIPAALQGSGFVFTYPTVKLALQAIECPKCDLPFIGKIG